MIKPSDKTDKLPFWVSKTFYSFHPTLNHVFPQFFYIRLLIQIILYLLKSNCSKVQHPSLSLNTFFFFESAGFANILEAFS